MRTRAKAIDGSNKNLGRIQATDTSTTDMAQEAENTMGASRAYPNRRGRKNKYNSSWKPPARTRKWGKRNEEELLYNGGRQKQELLQLWRIQTFSQELQKQRKNRTRKETGVWEKLLWQPLVIKTNDYTASKSLCYESRLKGLSQETTLVLSNTRELDRVPKTKQSTLYTIAHGPC